MGEKYKGFDEIKLLKKSKLYLDALSLGINPLTGECVEDPILQEKGIQNCFEYVSYVLGEVIEKGGLSKVSRKKKGRFVLTPEAGKRIKLSPEPIGINALADRINEVIDLSVSDKVSGVQLSDILLEMGYLSRVLDSRKKCINERSAEIGITAVKRNTLDGREYTQILYGIEAQRLLVQELIYRQSRIN